jgi:hypothetical protein
VRGVHSVGQTIYSIEIKRMTLPSCQAQTEGVIRTTKGSQPVSSPPVQCRARVLLKLKNEKEKATKFKVEVVVM